MFSTIDDEVCRVLLVEDDADDAHLVTHHLASLRKPRFQVDNAGSLAKATLLAGSGLFDVVLLNLYLPDSTGLATIDAFRAQWPGGPIVVLTGLDDELIGLDSIRHGAQDFLPKEDLSATLLVRTIQYAIERQRTVQPGGATEAEVAAALAEFASTLRRPIAELLVHAGALCEKAGSAAIETTDIERLQDSASQIVALLNRTTQQPETASAC
ncbi:MAG: hypothetical protein CMJ58_14490 [Planctomycetaceae bacterium]|nr:hypothetical protein [Planctomycetaceae bacterium]